MSKRGKSVVVVVVTIVDMIFIVCNRTKSAWGGEMERAMIR